VVAGDQLFEIGVQVEFFNGGDEGREQPDGKANPARSHEDVQPAAAAAVVSRAIIGALFEEPGPFLFADDAARPFRQQVRRQGVAGRAQFTADPYRRRQPRLQMQVAGSVVGRQRD